MKSVTVPVKKIVPNRFRNLDLFPLDAGHIADLSDSIETFGFFGGLVGRQLDNGELELFCGHARWQALLKNGTASVDVMLPKSPDDDMSVFLMVAENATQLGSHPSAVMNETAAAMRRLAVIVLEMDFSQIREKYGNKLFADKAGFERARGKLMARLNDPDKDGGLGEPLIRAYLDMGGSHRSQGEIRQAVSTLKQSTRYDQIVDDVLADIAQRQFASAPGPKAQGKAIQARKQPSKPRKKIIDDRCAAVFGNDYQFRAFKDAVTTDAGKRFIPVENQLALAKQIVTAMVTEGKASLRRKQAGAPTIKAYVARQVNEMAAQQREIDAEEKRKFQQEQIGEQIRSEVRCARASARSLLSSCLKLEKLWKESPGNLHFGDVGGTLGNLASIIERMRKQFRTPFE